MRLITDAPLMVVRDALALVPGARFGYASDEHPLWAETIIEAIPSDALALALTRLSSFRFDSFRPRVTNGAAIGDPVMAMAMASIERKESGGSSSPAFAR